MQAAITIGIILAALGGCCLFLFKTETGRDLIEHLTSKRLGVTNLQEADTLSSAEDVGAVAPGVSRDPYAIVLGYYIDQRNAGRVRRDPERNGQLVSTEPHLPTLIFGPPGSGKTTTLLQPAILTFGLGKSPVLAGSVKHDLAHATIKLREKLGTAQIFDPTGQTPASLRKYLGKWTPLAAARTWRGANETANAMVFASDESSAGDRFWSSQSVSLLSVMLFVTASQPNTSMQDVSELLGELLVANIKPEEDDGSGTAPAPAEDPKGVAYLQGVLEAGIRVREHKLADVQTKASAGAISVGEATSSIARLENRIDEFKAALESLLPFASVSEAAPPTAGGIVASLSNVMQVYRYARDYARIKWDDPELIDIDAFLLGGANTVYLCSPPRNMNLYAPLLSAFAAAVITRAYEIGQASPDGALPNGLLLAIDELAAMPLDDMAALFATGRSYKIGFCVATQDMSQLVDKMGEERTYSLLSSASSVVILPRTKDPKALDVLSKIAGETRVLETSTTMATSKSKSKGSEAGGKQEGSSESVTESYTYRPLLPPGKITTFAKNEAFAIVGNQRCQLLLRPWYDTEILRRLADGDVSALQEENGFLNVKTDLPSQPSESLVDMSTPVPEDPRGPRRGFNLRKPPTQS